MDVVVAKLNADGQWQWAKRFGSNYTGDEMGEDIAATADGGTYITGAFKYYLTCLLYTSDAADERSSVDLGGRRIIKKKNIQRHRKEPE